MILNDRKKTGESINIIYRRIAEIVLMLKQKELDSMRAGILNKLERVLAVVNNDVSYREGINKLDMAGLRSYERNLNQLLNKMTMGNDRVWTRMFSQYSERSIRSKEEPVFRPAGPVNFENMTADIVDYNIQELRNTRISQNDVRPEKPSGPCLFRSLQASAEEFAGENLNLKKINASAIKLEEDGSININNNYFINNPTAVVEDTLERLGVIKINAIIGNTSKVIEEEVNFTIRYIASKGHFQLSDENGDLIWDPYKYNNSENAYTGTYSSIRSIKIAALKVKK